MHFSKNVSPKGIVSYIKIVGGNLVNVKTKKQTVCARSSAESKYRATALGVT